MKNLLKKFFKAKNFDKTAIVDILKNAVRNKIIDNETLIALNIDNLKARDIMVPRYQIDVLNIDDNFETVVNKIIATGHSRFPVIDNDISNIVGIFNSKDLIQHVSEQDDFELSHQVRAALFTPETKRLDSLMYEMRLKQIHIAIVVDEFTNIVGLITLEMIIEQIIGDIADEYDSIEGENHLVELSANMLRVKGYCKLDQINNYLNINLDEQFVETISGYIVKNLARIPSNGEIITLNNLTIEVLNADNRKINLLTIKKK